MVIIQWFFTQYMQDIYRSLWCIDDQLDHNLLFSEKQGAPLPLVKIYYPIVECSDMK